MATKTMLFGTQAVVQPIPCPATGISMNSARWRDTRTFLNGGAAQRSSLTGHKEYTMSWGPYSQEDIDLVMDYLNGSLGPGPYYFLDPFAADKNVLPTYMASPYLGASDGHSMVTGVVPTVSLLTSTSNNLPAGTATYVITAGAKNTFFRGLVPAGYRILFGWYGTRTNSVDINVGLGYTPSTWSSTTAYTGTATTRFTQSVVNNTGAPTFFSMRWNGGATGGTAVVRSIQVIVVPNDGSAFPSGNFVSGRGSNGVVLASDPQVTGYSAVIPNANLAVSADFVEVGSWL